MWYFTWILGVLLACAFGIINVLWLEAQESMDQQTAVLDPLTKLPTRVEFLESLEKAINQYAANKTTFAMLFVGLNAFKQLSQQNDSEKLNQHILSITQIIKQETRQPIDDVSRYDAATFAIILPAADTNAANTIARRICERAESLTESPITSPVLSIGIVNFPADIDFSSRDSVRKTSKQLLQRANDMLNAARHKGLC